MKGNHCVCFGLLIVAILLLSSSSARPLLHEANDQVLLTRMSDTKIEHATSADQVADFSNLMGWESDEACREDDDECVKRRLVAEAHLDYIYTQHQKP